MTHCMSLKLACSSDWMVGKATITMVMSNSNMKVAAHTTTRVHHFFSMISSLRCDRAGRHSFADICMITTMEYGGVHGIHQRRCLGSKNHSGALRRPPSAVQPFG